jgi:putative flippase GtrA
VLRAPLGAVGANAPALALTAVANTAANRRLTFGIRGRADLLHRAARPVELAGLVLAGLAATMTRYVALRTWVFRTRRRRAASVGSAPAWPS